MKKVQKTLTANDLGLTGSHQAGMTVPREPRLLAFFPALDGSEKNPRSMLSVRERGDGTFWQFVFVYYNGKFFGGTRNEYRLTRMTRFLRSLGAKAGDNLIFEKDSDGNIVVALERASSSLRADGVLVLSGGWKLTS